MDNNDDIVSQLEALLLSRTAPSWARRAVEEIKALREEVADLAEDRGMLARRVMELRSELSEIVDAFAAVWIGSDRSQWDEKAAERFDALMVKVGGCGLHTQSTPAHEVTK